MSIFTKLINHSIRSFIAGVSAFMAMSLTHLAYAGVPHQEPLFLVAKVTPLMMLNMSKDHQLYFKLYDDYSDLDGDKIPDTTYLHSYDYYGYYDSNKCYTYDSTNNLFVPAHFTTDRYCDTTKTEWSGNFLNWATMTRMDAVRKILYGGYRSTDQTTSTVLERAFLPNDAHSFAKYYAGTDLRKLTPFDANDGDSDAKKRGITLCNTSEPKDRTYFSQGKLDGTNYVPNDTPRVRVARGNYSLWASNERWQCRWHSQVSANNSNDSSKSKIDAYSSNPVDANALGDYVGRVSVCSSAGLIDTKNNENCQSYGSSTIVYKPEGLLQAWGKNNKLQFGLMTGSYANNKSGGVLRKQISSFANEIDGNGIFTYPAYSIVKTINSLRIYGYRFDDGTYVGVAGSDDCNLGIASFKNGQCTNWGNPQAEIYLESLRYIAGKGAPAAAFSADDSSLITGLSTSPWNDPISSAADGNYCAPISILQFNASTTSHDADELGAASDVGIISVDTVTDDIGAKEGINGNSFFVGENATSSGLDDHQLCTAKVISSFSKALGICPEAPTVKGSYSIAGLAYKARTTKIGDAKGEYIQTYGVDLAPNIPSLSMPVPDTTNVVNILPACKNNRTTTIVNGLTGQPEQREGNCTIVNYKVVEYKQDGGINTAKLYVNWEAAEQGFDFDQDMWGIIDVKVTKEDVEVTTEVMAQSSGRPLAFGYVISGTNKDGFKVHSGINDFMQSGTYCDDVDKCTCHTTDATGACDIAGKITQKYEIANSSAQVLKSPMYYAARWGGYENDDANNQTTTVPDKYFKVTDPRALEQALNDAMAKTAKQVASSATVAANSTQYQTDTKVYQALFNSEDWSGQILAFSFRPGGTYEEDDADWNTDDANTIPAYTSRDIYTYDGATKVKVNSAAWDAGTIPTLKSYMTLSGDDATTAKERLLWLMGKRDLEVPGKFRERTKLLGDIVNSDPAYAGANNQHYENLPATYGAASYYDYVAAKANWKRVLFVGSNDGMMHAFEDGDGSSRELFAYIPRAAYPKLANLTKRDYVHSYIVDGPMYVGDVYFDSDADGIGGEWRTIVVGTMGAGGKGVYALDVTDVLSSGGTPKVLFDYADFDLPTSGKPLLAGDLGFIKSKVLIVPTADGNWHAIFGNGRHSSSGYAKLIAINIENPTNTSGNIVVINTQAKDGTTLDNGLSGVALLPGSDGVLLRGYAGDKLGNMWKFDLSDTSPTSWEVAFKSGSTPAPLIRVVDSLGNAQPIMAAPTLGLNNKKLTTSTKQPSTMVYFGTGKYDETDDLQSTAIQSIYGIADSETKLSLTTTNRTTMLQEKVISEPTATTREVSNDATGADGKTKVDWDVKSGWFVDLKVGATAKGERVINKPLLISDRVIVNTFIPSPNQCDFGGTGWVMELTGVGDLFIGHTVLGNTYLDMPIIGGLIVISEGQKGSIVGSGLGRKGVRSPLIDLDIDMGAGARGRMSWRQIK